MHSADLYSATKKYDEARIWADRISQEFTNQVKDEVDRMLPITAHM